MTTATLPATENERITAFVNRHQAGVWRWLRALGCDPAHAEEHCQDALLAALHAGADRWQPTDASRWLRRAAKNLFLMRLRAERRQPAWRSLDELEADWVLLRGDEDGGTAALAALDRCLSTLSSRERELVVHRYGEQQSRAVMAEQLGLGEAGIKQALRRVRSKLRHCVERRLSIQTTDTLEAER